MNKQFGYYRVFLEHEGFRTPLVVYAGSGKDAASKALDDTGVTLPGATIHDIEGPYTNFASIM